MIKKESPSLNINELESLWRQVQKPGRYTGGEWESIKKNPEGVKIKVALAFPEVYEIASSYLGQKILYYLLNQRDDLLAERVYAPWPDFEEQLRKNNLPLYSLENKIPLNDFDIVGFSLLYELNNTNLLTMLDLGQIPLLTAERDLYHPLIIAGGPAAFNPEPLSNFIDIFVLGDGEESFFEVIDHYLQIKGGVKNREELLKSFAHLPGVYIPYFYPTQSQTKSFLLIPQPQPGFPEKIRKRLIYPLEKANPPDKFIVPNIQTIFDRFQIEVARGCPQNCRFCQATSLYFPYRYRPKNQIVQSAYSGLVQTGYEELSLNALSVGDYPYLESVIEQLLPFLERKKTSISLPSLRPGGLSPRMVEDIVKIRKTGFTLVPEAGSERLRRVINKKISDEELFKAASYAFEQGWRRLKLYFMIGLPTETEDDLKAIINLIGQLVDLGKKVLGSQPAISLSVSSFIPKPHTPFQWLAMEEEKILVQKQDFIKKNIRKWKKVELKEHRIKTSILEAVFSRGDRQLGQVLEEAYLLGARFDGWFDLFRFELWEKAFEKKSLDYQSYLKKIDLEAELPWDIIETGIKKSHFKNELQMALQAKYSPSCQESDCQTCQACLWPAYKVKENEKLKLEKESGQPWPAIEIKTPPESLSLSPIRYRAAFQKTGLARFFSHNDLLNQLERAFRRADLPIAFSKGFNPKMLISFGPAMPLGMAGLAEILEFRALSFISKPDFLSKINLVLPEGLRFIGLKECSPDCRPLYQDITQLVYSLDLTDEMIKRHCPIEDKLNPDYISDYALKFEGQIKITYEPSWDRVYFYLDFNPQKPLKIQKVVAELLEIENSVYALTREYLIFRNGEDSRNLT
ncbi:MAG TPA: TIGR03960 family B12-binding radical SAM protein [Candidatus Aminicenantes bacterium]|nr:MAG: radical SAM protein [Candidatus Aminicenantes bacterium]HEK86320.1 TIGR03960 family B12-binding radical SAM protein [Candidatus Aminicenantes bacterium]